MSGTVKGGILAAITNKKLFGKDHYQKIGAMGGQVKGKTKGFGSNKALARRAGTIGGSVSGYKRRQHKLSGDSMDNIQVET